MAFTEDLSVFFDTDEFAVAALYDGATTVNVIFDNAYVEPVAGVASANPVAYAQGSDIPDAGVAIGKALVVDSVTYKIRNREPLDDGAVVLLQLEKQ